MNNSESPWYEGGLRFTCTQCGNCCTGDPGYVWVTDDEIDALANLIEVPSVEEFEDVYVRKIGARKSLREYPNGDCVFFDSRTRRCTVYEARPRQCRSWPFWPSNTNTPRDWEKTCEVCPGSGQGELYSLEEIQSRRGAIQV